MRIRIFPGDAAADHRMTELMMASVVLVSGRVPGLPQLTCSTPPPFSFSLWFEEP
jgi:hypothetical protein